MYSFNQTLQGEKHNTLPYHSESSVTIYQHKWLSCISFREIKVIRATKQKPEMITAKTHVSLE